MLDILVAEIGLNGARTVSLISQREVTGMPQHVRMSLEGRLGNLPARSTSRPRPAVVIGAPRSEVNTRNTSGLRNHFSAAALADAYPNASC
jgi:hypothetical protein